MEETWSKLLFTYVHMKETCCIASCCNHVCNFEKKKLLLNWCSEMIWCSKLWAAKSLTIYGHWVVCWSLNVPTSTQEFCVFEKCWGPCLSRPLQAIILQTLLYSMNHQSNACHLTLFGSRHFLFDKQFPPDKQQRVLMTEHLQQHSFVEC